jgi:hypothetical protein
VPNVVSIFSCPNLSEIKSTEKFISISNDACECPNAMKTRLCDNLAIIDINIESSMNSSLIEKANEVYDAKVFKNVPIEKAADMLGKSQQFIRIALQKGVAPFGFAVQISNKKWTYHISPKKLEEYIGTEKDVNLNELTRT